MKTSRSVGLLLGLAMAGTVAAQPAQTAPAAVSKVRDAYVAAVHAGDAKGIAGLYSEDGVEMPPNQAMAKGRPAIEKYHAGLLTGHTVKLSLTPMETIASGDVAYDVGTYSQTVTPKQSDGTPMNDRGKYVVLLRRASDGTWRVRHAIYNSDLPPRPGPPTAK
jgi:uncharacterized protein (TIGR02246 family)